MIFSKRDKKKDPEIGTKRIVYKFSFWPVDLIDGRTAWLQYVWFKEVYTCLSGAYDVPSEWKWVSKAAALHSGDLVGIDD